jgi:hypothetical protein
MLVVLTSRSDTSRKVLRRSTHGPARRSQAPRRATRGPWPRLRYRLNSSPRRCSLCGHAAGAPPQAPPRPDRSHASRPRGVRSRAVLHSAPRGPGCAPSRCRSSARSTLGLRGRSGRPPLCSTPADRSTRPRRQLPAAAPARPVATTRLDTSAPRRSRRTPRRAAPSSIPHAIPRALRSAQRDK